MEIPFSPADLEEAVCQTIAWNGFSACYVRPICYYGSGVLGLNPRSCPLQVAVLAWPWAPLLGNDSLSTGVRVTVSPWVKFESRMLPTTAKACGQYLNSILALRDADARGFDEALLLDSEGNVAEGSGENLFLVKDGRVVTNDEGSSILLGVTRDAVIELARDLGFPVEIGRISLEELLSADEAFLTGTAAEVTPIREVDGRPIGSGLRGEVTERLQLAFYAAAMGRDRRYSRWLHPVVSVPAAAIPEVRQAANAVAE
jgi:branched-chain amino acid aminotransferase